MPLTKFNFKPGINKQDSDLASEGMWKDSDMVRFRYGQPEKIGGWKYVTTDSLIGAARGQFAWTDLDGVKFDAIGTDRKLYIYSEGQFLDITPVRATANITSVFETTNGSTTITVNHTDHGAVAGDFVTITNSSASVGGISSTTLNAEYEIISVPNSNSYTVVAGSAATSNVTTATANCTVAYQIPIKREFSSPGAGWNAGPWNDSTWNTERETSVVIFAGGQWTFANFGEDLLAWQQDGKLYTWDTSGGMTSTNRASAVSGAPTANRLGLMTTPDRHVVCFGTETTIGTTSTQDDLFIRWADQESTTDWTPTATNTAGSQRLSGGSRIECALLAKQQVLVWTDANLFAMRFVGPPFTFGFNQLGVNCGTVGPHSAVDVSGVTYWMSKDSFFMYDGTVRKIPCTVEDYVFDDINLSQNNEVFASSNSKFNEVTWFYTSEDGSQIDRYVTYNYMEGLWYTGSLARTTWVDTGIYDLPYATKYIADSTATATPTVSGVTDGRSFLFSHETGTDDVVDGSTTNAITAYIESSDFDIGDGQDMMAIRKMIPDFKGQAGTANLQLKVRDYPYGTQTTKSANAITTSTTKVDTRARGRQAAIKIYSDATSATWRFGTLRMDLQPDGRR